MNQVVVVLLGVSNRTRAILAPTSGYEFFRQAHFNRVHCAGDFSSFLEYLLVQLLLPRTAPAGLRAFVAVHF